MAADSFPLMSDGSSADRPRWAAQEASSVAAVSFRIRWKSTYIASGFAFVNIVQAT